MHRDEQRVAKRWRKLRSSVEPQIDWRDVRREIECRRYGVGDGDVALRGAQLGLADVRLILRDEEREAVVLAGFDEIDLVGRKIVAEIVLSGLAGPHASGVRIPVEAAGVVQTARVRLQRAVARQNLNRRAARVGFNTDVARRAYRYVEPAVGTEVDRARHVQRWRGGGQVDDLLGFPLRSAVRPSDSQHRWRRRDVEPAVLEREAVRVGEIAQDHLGRRGGVPASVLSQRNDLATGSAGDEQRAFGAHRHQPRAGKIRCEHRRLESGRHDQLGGRRRRRRLRCDRDTNRCGDHDALEGGTVRLGHIWLAILDQRLLALTSRRLVSPTRPSVVSYPRR